MSDTQKRDPRHPGDHQREQAAASRETSRPADSTPIVAGQFAKLPVTFGRYQVERLLGRGAMGAVYLARDTQLNRCVALKIPKVAASGSKRLLARLETEAKAAAQLDHPSLCKVYDAGAVGEQCFIAMQYIEGETLKAQLEVKSKSVAEAVTLIVQLAEGLSEAHELGIIHRDLKPENIMINRRGMPVIMDFGLAKLSTVNSNAVATQAGTILGSPAYMSPEQASGQTKEIDQRSDIYSLGTIFFELLTGQLPFAGSTMQILGQKSILEPASPLSVQPDLPPQLAAICHKMIAKKNVDRHQTLSEVIADLKQFDAAVTLSLAAQSVESPEPSPSIFPDFAASHPTADSNASSVKSRKKKPTTDLHGAKGGIKTVTQRIMAWWSDRPPAIKWTAFGGMGVLFVLGVIIITTTNKDGTRTSIKVDDMSKIAVRTSKASEKLSEAEEPSDDLSHIDNARDSAAFREHQPYWVSQKWINDVAALPIEQQIAAVQATLQERNVNFDGQFQHHLRNGVVTAVQLKVDTVHDLSPLLAFSKLQSLDCSCTDPWISPLGDLSPLTHLPLRSLKYPYHTWLGAESLRSIKTLKTVNDLPRADFWKKVDSEAEEFERFRKMVAVLTPAAQQQAIVNRIKAQNPGSSGYVETTIENDAIVQMYLPTDKVVDCSPVRALPNLKALNLSTGEDGPGKLKDLTPLRGMATVIDLNFWKCYEIRELTALQGMKLQNLDLSGCSGISDLGPLKGMPLERLSLARIQRISDLSPLADTKLRVLSLWGLTQVRDLSPLEGLPIEELNLDFCTQISDLKAIGRLPLRKLYTFGSAVVDITPIEGSQLELISFYDVQRLKGAELLIRMKTLKNIWCEEKQFTATEFWASDKGRALLASSSSDVKDTEPMVSTNLPNAISQSPEIPKKSKKTSLDDPLEVGSVWDAERAVATFTVLERKGTVIRVHYEFNRPTNNFFFVNEVQGKVIGNKVSWQGKDAKIISGGRCADAIGTISERDGSYRIDFEWNDGTTTGTIAFLKKM